MSLVIDCSIAIAWLMPDEQAAEADRAMEAVIRTGAEVPALFLPEVGNVLLMNERRGRILSTLTLLADLLSLELRQDLSPSHERIAQAIALAERHRLSVYDASYLELARRLSLPLATLDGALRRAAGEAGVALFDA